MEPYRQQIGQVGSGAPLDSPMSEALTEAACSTSSWQSCDCSPVPVPRRRRRQRCTCSELVVSGCMAHGTRHSYRTQRHHLWAKQGDTGPVAELLCTSQHSLTGLAHLGTSLPACAHAGTAVARGWPFLLSSVASGLLALASAALPREQPASWHNGDHQLWDMESSYPCSFWVPVDPRHLLLASPLPPQQLKAARLLTQAIR